MERICPFLATSDDARTVVDGFDRAHVCRAEGGRDPVDRSQQLGYCLGANHPGCERFARAMERRGPISWPAPAGDAEILQTRLVLPPDMARRSLGVAGIGSRSRRWLMGGAVATIGVAAVAAGVAGSLGGIVAATPDASSPEASPSLVPEATPLPVASVDVTPSQVPTQPPTSAPSSSPAATGTPVPTATPAPPEPRTYIVQPGDTLNGIAIRFGTTVDAIRQANSLGASDVILVGQVLIIP